MSTELYDITIIGGGPAGMYAAFYAGLRDAKTKIIDSLPQLGGQLAALYPEKYVYDIPGFAKVLASEFVERQVEQAMRFSPTVCLNEKVVKLERREDGTFALHTEPENLHLTKTVIIAAGVGAFVPRTLDIPDVKRMEGKGVYYFVRDLEAFRGRRVVVIGGGDTAVDWAQRLLGIASEVRLVNRSDRFRAHEETIKELRASTCEVCVFQELKALHGKDRVEAATLFDNRTGEEHRVEVDAIVLGLGFLANLGPNKEWGLQIAQNSVVVDHTMQTSLPGVYGVGDLVTYEGKLKLIATATGEAAVAANYAKNRIDPASKISPGHSSDRDK